MKITRIVKKNNLNQVMDISVDVYKDNLIFFAALKHQLVNLLSGMENTRI